MSKNIYGSINTPKDITSINRKIRSEIAGADSKPRIRKLKLRSKYLITLMSGPALRKRKNASALKRRAIKEWKETKIVADKRLGL